MAENSKIEWCNHTLNLWWGCTEVHAGCDHCYSRVFSDDRYKKNLWGNDKGRLRIRSSWKDLDRYQRLAIAAKQYHTVFVGSMMDIFEKTMPLQNPIDHYETTDDLRQELFSRIIANLYPNLIFLFLTKRPSNIARYVPSMWIVERNWSLWFGISIVDDATAGTLLNQFTGGFNKFLSIEPQLAAIDLINRFYMKWPPVDWIIQGGESGHHRRPFDLDWARSMQKQAKQMKIPYFFKQIDKIQQIPEDLLIRQLPWG